MVGCVRQRNNMDVGKITHAPSSQQKGIKTLLKGDDGARSDGSHSLCCIGFDSDKFFINFIYRNIHFYNIATIIFLIRHYLSSKGNTLYLLLHKRIAVCRVCQYYIHCNSCKDGDSEISRNFNLVTRSYSRLACICIVM